MDEKPVTLHADVRPAARAAPGREARFDSEYERRGTANVFCAVEPKAGRHFTFVTPNRSGPEFAKALFDLALAYPQAETIHLVMDNLSTHSCKSLTALCGEGLGGEIWECFTPHYTPAHGSWLNQAEIEIGLFARQCLGKRRIPDLATLRRETRAWVAFLNVESDLSMCGETWSRISSGSRSSTFFFHLSACLRFGGMGSPLSPTKSGINLRMS